MKIIYSGKEEPSCIQNDEISEICNRHMLVFGENIQKKISDLSIGVVSVGGLGSVIIEQIMRLYPRKLIYIDKDKVELSNLNRLVGANITDSKLKVKKVDLASRNILEFNPDQEILPLRGDFLIKENQEQFRECDFIIGASDSNAVRIATNRLCLANGIIYLDCGVGAIVKNKHLTAAGGQIIKILPDSDFCLHCSGMFNVREAMNEFLSPEEKTRQKNLGYIRGTNITAPQVYSLNMMVASWAIWLFKRIISEEKLGFDGIAINAKDFTTHTWNEPKRKSNDCTTCGVDGIVFNGDDVDLLCRDNNESDISTGLESEDKIEENHTDIIPKGFLADTHCFKSALLGSDRNNNFLSNIFYYM